MLMKSTQDVNFINALCKTFAYESTVRSIFVIQFECFCQKYIDKKDVDEIDNKRNN